MARIEQMQSGAENMSCTLVHPPARAFPQLAGDHASQHGYSPSPAFTWIDTVRIWVERSRQRRALGELGELNDALLKDIGVSRQAALREAAKRFWQK
jgi:uncharacterized protein YjiS (DUF1127 family)